MLQYVTVDFFLLKAGTDLASFQGLPCGLGMRLEQVGTGNYGVALFQEITMVSGLVEMIMVTLKHTISRTYLRTTKQCM